MIIKRLSVFATIMILALATQAQSYYNEWIDYAKTYYRFKVGSTGICRITTQDLNTVGLSATNGESFQLWRNGKEVPLFVSFLSGNAGPVGFIEFWAEKNDGAIDKDLYRVPAYQLNNQVSLLTDTAAYFLTVNTTGSNQRYANAANNVAGNQLPAESYFMHTVRSTFKDQINRGLALPAGSEYVYSSAYDVGEMWSSFEIYPATPTSITIPDLFVAGSAPVTAKFLASMAGTAPNYRTYQIDVNNTKVTDSALSAFAAGYNVNNNVPLSALASNAAVIKITNKSTVVQDRIVAGFVELTYPRQFNFGGAANFTFSLPASAQGNYIEISNFNGGGVQPVLYDLTNKRRYVGDISTPGLTRFVLPASSTVTSFALASIMPANVIKATGFETKNFTNYLVAANQGDYLIITHSSLQQPFNGVNQVQAYATYRNSNPGGSFNAKVIDIDEIVDQFGYGIKKNPLGVKNFLRYARAKFAATPKFAFLIGKGVNYSEYRMNQQSPFADRLNLIPTWGYPASDIMLASDNLNPVMNTGLGRLSAVSPNEVADYLQKVKQYELAQQTPAQTIEAKEWMKNVVHVVGGNDQNIEALLTGYMRGYENTIKDTLFGANVTTFSKTTTGPATPITGQLMAQMFQKGISIINYFGHSSATTLDYNLDDPYSYNNQGKYPMFIVNGCNAGNLYSFDTTRFSLLSTLSERFVLAKERGSIGFIASTHFGLTSYLDYYNQGLYRSISGPGYGKSISKNINDANIGLLSSPYGPEVMGARLHAEETTLHGDPAIVINSHAKADFVVEEPQIRITPNIVSVADLKFDVKAYIYNIGKATGDSVKVQLKHQYPDGSSAVLIEKKIRSIRYVDSLTIQVPIDAVRDRGQNKILVTVDLDNKYDELSESNNSNAKAFVIQENDIRPVYPYNFSIINRNNAKLFASTANPLATSRQYVMEMDTTELFTSSFKISRTVTSVGGLVQFDPGVTYTDSTVYYWRVAVVPAAGPVTWNTSSFVYLPGANLGYNQSHVYQHFKSSLDRIALDSLTREWKYQNNFTSLVILNSVFAVSGFYDMDNSISVNGSGYINSACVGHSIIFNVFDPVKMKPYFNQANPSTVQNGPLGFFMGSGSVCAVSRNFNFEFSVMDTTNRRKIRDFLDWVPAGSVVVARYVLDAPYDQNPYAPQWQADAVIYGAGNTMYDRLKAAGFAELDSFNRPRTWSFIYKKNDPTFTPQWKLSNQLEMITMNLVVPSLDTLGYITSPKFGPAVSWKEVIWRGKSIDPGVGDNATVDVIGINNAGTEQVLYTLNTSQQNFNISSVSATQYPYLKLRMKNEDKVNLTPYQLRYWRIYYDPVPEGGLVATNSAPIKDTFEIGEKINFSIGFRNVSDASFADSIRVKAILYDKNNVPTIIPMTRRKKLLPGDSIVVSTSIDTRNLDGTNTLYIDVNPDLELPEQFRFNNFMYKNFIVKPDVYNPNLDVTFDGVRILNGDLVSAKPKVVIKLRDDSKFLALNDTSLATVFIQYPGTNGQLKRFNYLSDTLRFIPADVSTGNNEATIEFNPAFLDDSGNDFYTLIVRGKDRAGNPAGNLDYSVKFQVINKPMITNMFNYPNPFTSSTAFVFTLTGTEIPQNLRIQILTVTGKIVKEITKNELGALHIGRNITDYKWDGTDQYGSKLANGIYLYRVITNMNGTTLEKYTPLDASGSKVNTDQYFNKGYGKMYLMR
jgi:hypothetical protein